jgi:hypothetical protein
MSFDLGVHVVLRRPFFEYVFVCLLKDRTCPFPFTSPQFYEERYAYKPNF